MSRKQMPFWDFSCRFSSHSTQTNERDCFIFQGTPNVVHAVFYRHAFHATRKYLWWNRDDNENEKHTHPQRRAKTNLKDKMPSDVLKGDDAKEVHFDFQFICARLQPLSEHYSVRKLHTIQPTFAIDTLRRFALHHPFYGRRGFCSRRRDEVLSVWSVCTASRDGISMIHWKGCHSKHNFFGRTQRKNRKWMAWSTSLSLNRHWHDSLMR